MINLFKDNIETLTEKISKIFKVSKTNEIKLSKILKENIESRIKELEEKKKIKKKKIIM